MFWEKKAFPIKLKEGDEIRAHNKGWAWAVYFFRFNRRSGVWEEVRCRSSHLQMKVHLGGSEEEQILAAKGIIEIVAGFAGHRLNPSKGQRRVGLEREGVVVQGWIGEPVNRV